MIKINIENLKAGKLNLSNVKHIPNWFSQQQVVLLRNGDFKIYTPNIKLDKISLFYGSIDKKDNDPQEVDLINVFKNRNLLVHKFKQSKTIGFYSDFFSSKEQFYCKINKKLNTRIVNHNQYLALKRKEEFVISLFNNLIMFDDESELVKNFLTSIKNKYMKEIEAAVISSNEDAIIKFLSENEELLINKIQLCYNSLSKNGKKSFAFIFPERIYKNKIFHKSKKITKRRINRFVKILAKECEVFKFTKQSKKSNLDKYSPWK